MKHKRKNIEIITNILFKGGRRGGVVKYLALRKIGLGRAVGIR